MPPCVRVSSLPLTPACLRGSRSSNCESRLTAAPALPCAGGHPPQRPPEAMPPCVRVSSLPLTPACLRGSRSSNCESRITNHGRPGQLAVSLENARRARFWRKGMKGTSDYTWVCPPNRLHEQPVSARERVQAFRRDSCFCEELRARLQPKTTRARVSASCRRSSCERRTCCSGRCLRQSAAFSPTRRKHASVRTPSHSHHKAECDRPKKRQPRSTMEAAAASPSGFPNLRVWPSPEMGGQLRRG